MYIHTQGWAIAFALPLPSLVGVRIVATVAAKRVNDGIHLR